jgi:hypothetical protein
MWPVATTERNPSAAGERGRGIGSKKELLR